MRITCTKFVLYVVVRGESAVVVTSNKLQTESVKQYIEMRCVGYYRLKS